MAIRATAEGAMLKGIGAIGGAAKRNVGNLVLRGEYRAAGELAYNAAQAVALGGGTAAGEVVATEVTRAATTEQTMEEAGERITEQLPGAVAGGAIGGIFILGGAAIHSAIKGGMQRGKVVSLISKTREALKLDKHPTTGERLTAVERGKAEEAI